MTTRAQSDELLARHVAEARKARLAAERAQRPFDQDEDDTPPEAA